MWTTAIWELGKSVTSPSSGFALLLSICCRHAHFVKCVFFVRCGLRSLSVSALKGLPAQGGGATNKEKEG